MKQMIENALKKKWVKEITVIIFAYFIIHGFLLLLTGTFWDDWLYYFHDIPTANMAGWESGRPYYSWVIETVWILPGYGYRVLSFFTYLLSYLFIYGSFYSIKSTRNKKALYITLICMALPINDARLLLSNYPYAMGMLLFWGGCFVLTHNIHRLNNALIRFGVLLLFFLSFTLNSNLALYGIVIAYLIIYRGTKRIYTLLDFIILPIAFYITNQMLFPVYGAYEDYNVVTVDKVLWSIIAIPEMVLKSITSIFSAICKENLFIWIGLITVGVTILIKILNKKYQHNESVQKRFLDYDGESIQANKLDALIFSCGLITLLLGLFPYVVVRQDSSIAMTGIQGRDSMQIGIGIALVFVGGINRKIQEYITLFIVVFGALHFNMCYLTYQSEWYLQLALQNRIVGVESVERGGNFVVYCSQDFGLDDRRLYTWSGLVADATGNRNCFFMDGDKDKYVINNSEIMDSILSHYPMYSEYVYDHTSIDGRITITTYFTLSNTVCLKYYEYFDHDKFNYYINELSDVEFCAELE